MRLPSIRDMKRRGFTDAQAKQVRYLLERYRDRYGSVLYGVRPVSTMEKISEVIGGFGVETIPQGRNAKSPRIDYVNLGDTYATTILYVNHSFRIGAWGDIVERGNYD